jgi:mannose-6-phosphate isomerase-like protein (cupin superfamily)
MDIQIKRLAQDGVEFHIGDGCRAQALVSPGMGSIYRSMHHIEIPALHKTKELVHKDSEAAYFIVQGKGKATDVETGEEFAVQRGNMLLLDAGTRYCFEAFEGETMICIGGPCPPDHDLYITKN